MALLQSEPKYSSIQFAEADLENDSDTTLRSTEFLHQSAKTRRRSSRNSGSHSLFTWLRWTIVIVLQTVVILLLLQNSQATARKSSEWSQASTETGGDINGLYVPSKDSSETDPCDDTNSSIQPRTSTRCWLQMKKNTFLI